MLESKHPFGCELHSAAVLFPSSCLPLVILHVQNVSVFTEQLSNAFGSATTQSVWNYYHHHRTQDSDRLVHMPETTQQSRYGAKFKHQGFLIPKLNFCLISYIPKIQIQVKCF